jgi:diadenosine tetraphosphate (Ap4A) HIT family hydrolase
MSGEPKEWMPRERWESLIRGEDCPLCVECQSTETVDPYGYTVAQLQLSRLRLVRNQFVRGYCILICNTHVQEPYQLSDVEQSLFFDDMMRTARALDQVFAPIKMNYHILGNMIPHLHVHLVPRYYGDAAPSRPIDPSMQIVELTEEEYGERVQLIQSALGM